MFIQKSGVVKSQKEVFIIAKNLKKTFPVLSISRKGKTFKVKFKKFNENNSYLYILTLV